MKIEAGSKREGAKMKIRLEHAKNVDMTGGQGNGSGYWTPPADKRLMTIECAALADCVKALVAWRDRNGLGGGNMARRCGEVSVDGRVVALVSYNGRVWTPYDMADMQEWRDKSELVA